MESYANLFNQKLEHMVTYEPNMYVRIKKGLYEGDLAKIYKVKKSSVDVLIVPRINVPDIVMRIKEQTSNMTDADKIAKTKETILKLLLNHHANNYKERPFKKPILE